MQDATLEVVPISHASLILQWGKMVVYVDPVGDALSYAAHQKPDILLVTHEHGDHFSVPTLNALVGPSTRIIAPQSVFDTLPEHLQHIAVVMKNGNLREEKGFTIEAIPAYNIRQEALQYHPKGRDNGYVLESGGIRVYVAGDTEDTPEMRALQNIDIAFIPMNLPYTMSYEKAAEAVLAFTPSRVYPYHYEASGRAHTEKFKQLVEASNPDIEIILADWYS